MSPAASVSPVAGPRGSTTVLLAGGALVEGDAVRAALVAHGFRVVATGTVPFVVDRLFDTRANLLVVDGDSAVTHDRAFWKELRLRSDGKHLPVLVVTASTDESEGAWALDLGADDCMAAPFSSASLVARIRALLRRSGRPIAKSAWRCGDLSLDHDTRRARRGGQTVHLGPTEYRLLALMIRHPGCVFPRDELLDRIWGDVHVEPRTVDVHIGRLRRALNAGGGADIIQTVRAVGYALQAPADC